ncbi:DUF1292 domain-containing protein [Paenibacillus bouchesdurhonensis]|uniref:DUF1292 domain-containing protein n=1 Tax=Paenibacillus bouchesdurhonensis TaxID=1870990 RepID=UPI000DA5EC8F|nr:DUF1292 domain-containing protein [Paenibacillus bouchesdurhonensis]
MPEFSAADVVWTSRVLDAFGTVVELEDEQGHVSCYSIEKEFDVAGGSYAVLRAESAANPEPEIFKIISGQDGALELVTIDDDDEWENVTELYDELTFPE